ncbi:uncharacterized protein YALI1_C31151g [Yarrowia lipolytica]|uniref:Uncharacterized protein n=1 Tax=Yarrowia lipolytica TaxID=4952 RepID=A0A1D8NCB0_YARLL|nr:hypothetical protein YALI1_C31151g [Yarrowia lipolytica]
MCATHVTGGVNSATSRRLEVNQLFIHYWQDVVKCNKPMYCRIAIEQPSIANLSSSCQQLSSTVHYKFRTCMHSYSHLSQSHANTLLCKHRLISFSRCSF